MILLQENGILARAMSRFSKPPPSATRPPLRRGKPYIFCAFPSNADRPNSPIRHIKASAPDTKTDTPGSAARSARSTLVPVLAVVLTILALPTAAHARPPRWCGWYARTQVDRDPGVAFNLARNWARWGRPASPGIGVMVVWGHHVGKIVGRDSNGNWIIRSGNDGHAVRTRARSVARAIAFRAER